MLYQRCSRRTALAYHVLSPAECRKMARNDPLQKRVDLLSLVVLLNIRAKIPPFAPKAGLAHFRWKTPTVSREKEATIQEQPIHPVPLLLSFPNQNAQDPQKRLNIRANYHHVLRSTAVFAMTEPEAM